VISARLHRPGSGVGLDLGDLGVAQRVHDDEDGFCAVGLEFGDEVDEGVQVGAERVALHHVDDVDQAGWGCQIRRGRRDLIDEGSSARFTNAHRTLVASWPGVPVCRLCSSESRTSWAILLV